MVATEAGRDIHYTYEIAPTIFVRLAPRLRIVSVKIDEYVLRLIDETWRRLGYSSRSEFIREAVIWYMHAIRLAASGRRICACPCDNEKAKPLDEILDEFYNRGGANDDDTQALRGQQH